MDLPDLHLRSRLRADGHSDDEIRRWVRTGELGVVRRGAYVAGAPPAEAVPRHVLGIRAAVPALAAGAVVSHASAAVLYGFSLWAVPLRRVHVTRSRRTGGRRDSTIHVHTAPLDADEVTVVDGLPVTSPARTVIDIARTVPFEQAVVIADAALQTRAVDRDLLETALLRAAGWPGVPAARRAVAFADGAAESVGESRSRVALLRAGLPSPVLQWEAHGRDGRLLGRVDFAWPQVRTVGEFDGRVKYGRLLRPGQDPGDAVFAEKRREDALRDADLGVIRWTWADLSGFDEVAARIRRRFRTS